MCPVISIPFAKCEVTSLIISSLSRKLEQIQTLQLPTRVLDNHLILSHAPAHNKCNSGRYMYMFSDSFSGFFDTNIARNNCINTQTCICSSSDPTDIALRIIQQQQLKQLLLLLLLRSPPSLPLILLPPRPSPSQPLPQYHNYYNHCYKCTTTTTFTTTTANNTIHIIKCENYIVYVA